VQCVGRTEPGECDELTFFASIVEDQVGTLLGNFAIPEAKQASLLAAW
jgi:hypothetical protein